MRRVREVGIERGAIVDPHHRDEREVGRRASRVRRRRRGPAADLEAADRRDVAGGALDRGDQRVGVRSRARPGLGRNRTTCVSTNASRLRLPRAARRATRGRPPGRPPCQGRDHPARPGPCRAGAGRHRSLFHRSRAAGTGPAEPRTARAAALALGPAAAPVATRPIAAGPRPRGTPFAAGLRTPVGERPVPRRPRPFAVAARACARDRRAACCRDRTRACGRDRTAGLLPRSKAGLRSRSKGGLLPRSNAGLRSRSKGGLLPRSKAGLRSRSKGGLLPRSNAGLRSRSKGGLLPRSKAGLRSRSKGGLLPRSKAGLRSRSKGGLLPRSNAGLRSRSKGGLLPRSNAGLRSRSNAGFRSRATGASGSTRLRPADDRLSNEPRRITGLGRACASRVAADAPPAAQRHPA